MNTDLPPGAVVIVGGRTEDYQRVPVPGSAEFPCDRCACAVVLSPATQRRRRPQDIVLCMPCAAAVSAQRGYGFTQFPRNDEQIAEIKEAGGLPSRFLGKQKAN